MNPASHAAPRRPRHLRRTTAALTVATLVALVALGACSSDSDDGSGSQTSKPSSSTTTTLAAGPADQPAPVDQRPPVAVNGLALRGGRLFLADLKGGEILAVDPENGRITARWGTALGLDAPDDLALATDGSLYFSGYLAGTVGRISPAGDVSTIATLGPGVNPIAFSADGELFAGRAQLAEGIYEVALDGAPPRLVTSSAGQVNSFAFGPGGALYGPRFGLDGAGALVRIDPESGATDVVTTGFGFPVAVEVRGNTAYVLQAVPAKLFTVDLDTGAMRELATLATVPDNLALGPDGTFWVSSFVDPVVVVLGPDGTPARELRIGEEGR